MDVIKRCRNNILNRLENFRGVPGGVQTNDFKLLERWPNHQGLNLAKNYHTLKEL